MKTKNLLASLAVGTAMVAVAAPVNPTFTLHQDPAFYTEMTAAGTLAWADYNNDGLLDYFIVSGQGEGSHIGLYRNNGNGDFTNVTEECGELAYCPLSAGAAAWIDYDNDGNLDLIIAGSKDGNSSASSLTYVFHNEGPSQNYALLENWDIEDQLPCFMPDGQDCKGILMAVADFDNDGWNDLLIGSAYAASDPDMKRLVRLYRNNQNGGFVACSNPEFLAMSGTTVYTADFNNDGLMDFVTGGWNDDLGGDVNTPTVYLNKGDMTFTCVTGWGYGSHQGTIFPIDYNNDGKMDIIETGRNCVLLNWGHVARLYENNGDGTGWTAYDETVTGIYGSNSAVGFGDINNDGLTDFISSGWNNGNSVHFYLNNGDKTFVDVTEAVYDDKARARDGDVVMVDYNNDGKLDINIYGYRDGGNNDDPASSPVWPNFLLENTSSFAANQAPTKPLVTSCVQDGNDIVITWEASTDDTTPSEAIRYNVCAKWNDGKVFCLAPADLTTGQLKVNRTNAFISSLSYRFKNLNLSDLEYVGVQAVDNAFAASKFRQATTGVDVVKSETAATFVANGEINVINSGSEAATYAVYAANGVQVAAGTVAANSTAKVVPAAGIYVVKVNAADGVAVTKVVL